MGPENIKVSWGGCMNYDDFFNKYVSLLGKIYKRESDYLEIKTRVHNRAMRQLIALEEELSRNIPMAEKLYFELMKNEDEYIQWHASASCLSLGILVEESLKILDDIIANGDRWMLWHAERTLKIWRGEIRPDQPG